MGGLVASDGRGHGCGSGGGGIIHTVEKVVLRQACNKLAVQIGGLAAL